METKEMEKDLTRLKGRLERIYGKEGALGILPSLIRLLEFYKGRVVERQGGWSEKDSFLITYADSIVDDESPIRSLHQFLNFRVGDVISFVHLLPFYPYTSDDGFSVVDFREIREDLGSWEDVEAMAEDFRLVFDAVINHVSASSPYMEGFCSGDERYEDFFVSLDPETDTSSVLRTRNLPLFHPYDTCRGKEWLWTTFSEDQIDLNYANPRVLLEVLDILLFFTVKGASMIRLDAIPYLWKELGTSCAHLPETHEIIKLIRDVYDSVAPHVLLLTETNVPHRENISYFGDKGDEAQMIYNFSLPPLIVWSLLKGDASILTKWAAGLEFISPTATYLNITATHDGIGMRPTEGILSEDERAELVQMSYDRGGDMTGKRNSDGSVSPYELNLSYFDAVNDPSSSDPEDLQVKKFLLSQAIPMALMGIPGIYIHSLLGSRNDLEGMKMSGRARSINRSQLQLQELSLELDEPESLRGQVLRGYSRLLSQRQKQRAFHPDSPQKILDLGPSFFAVHRGAGGADHEVLALHNVSGKEQELELSGWTVDLLDDEFTAGSVVEMTPYQVRWLRRSG
ncbi:sugar phosphorylase [Puniceicoccus vermicola]|uniref:Sugar phosphorylase n=1 Tax=Puniceicoccus vermicola TaxID=388746 RepID=A0A7X1B1B0_9BACT|nr:sugar phosphorylase [Puniceicoccus vermicola]MBC2603781.1 sugar phosphorylase [Puniceicoccus vermicola]